MNFDGCSLCHAQHVAAPRYGGRPLGVDRLDLTSLGSPANTTLTATWEGSAAAAVTVPTGRAAARASGAAISASASISIRQRGSRRAATPVLFSSVMSLSRFL